jgi:small redox-active disulfide protein 2
MIEIKILGKGCSKCKVTYSQVLKVVNELDIEVNIVKVEDINDILEYSILSTPGLVINEQLKLSGRIPSTQEIKKWLLEVNQSKETRK